MTIARGWIAPQNASSINFKWVAELPSMASILVTRIVNVVVVNN